jgi:hypothetical protein
MNNFLKDLQTIYNQISKRAKELNSYYDIANNKEHSEASRVCEDFLEHIGLPKNKESIVASLNYIVNLREDNLVQFMQNMGLNQEIIDTKLELAYNFNSKLYLQRFEELISFIEQKELLTPFYRAIISGVHSIGEVITKWQNKWKNHIINKVNRELFELFKGDEEKIFQMLEKENLLDCKDGKIADRCYSVLIKEKNGYKRLSYADAFKSEVSEIALRLDILISTLNQLEDNIYNQKQEWINYFSAIKEAFTHTQVDSLVSLWADVDRAWMKITTPLQVGHPLEYYEDKYRKAVALEWDLRVINPTLQEGSTTKSNIKKAATRIASSFGKDAQIVIAKNLIQVDNAQLYIGQPVLYYGAELNGLFSAQVVPNDEEVSAQLGKKIFAYLDFVRESKKSKPIMQLAINTFGYDFIKKQKDLVTNNPKLWNKIYDISTIGHEFGHILWIDSDTEVAMNKSGQFKNIEEFKATTGGIMAFFQEEQEELKEPFIDDIVSRAVSLMAWREVDEVLPYYCEGLIHLELLYNSGIIGFKNGMVFIDYSKYNSFKKNYADAYLELVRSYLNKEDASIYLSLFTTKEDKNYLPKTEAVYNFVQSYYKSYKQIGNQVAKEFKN